MWTRWSPGCLLDVRGTDPAVGQPPMTGGWELEGEDHPPPAPSVSWAVPRSLHTAPQKCPWHCAPDAHSGEQLLAHPPPTCWPSLLACSSLPAPHPCSLGSFPQTHGTEASSRALLAGGGGRTTVPVLFSDHVLWSCLFISLILTQGTSRMFLVWGRAPNRKGNQTQALLLRQ